MGRDAPPQTIPEAIEMGWTALAFHCNRCKHDGTIDLARFATLNPSRSLAWLFWRCRCGKCGCRPTYARLALPIRDGSWHYKRIEVDGDMIRRAARE
jgi:hypothetical protein